ncbi:hypothetical protein COV19_02975 [Candidatus Woesearchaeota archaeon CG10_big_fil_rev_8_21_14_0_10_44_13]|nr:MAG: hypothetical protein COV19_02975 [Candidatus Woesearchaeota archaeon CG10_big_fil_rev_8_21_14_0_10_44_13]
MKTTKALLFIIFTIMLIPAAIAASQPAPYGDDQATRFEGCTTPKGCAGDDCSIDTACFDVSKINWKTIESGQLKLILKTDAGKNIDFNENDDKRLAFTNFVQESTTSVSLILTKPNGALKYKDGKIIGSFGEIDLNRFALDSKKYPGQRYGIEIKDDGSGGNNIIITSPIQGQSATVTIPKDVSGVSFVPSGSSITIDLTNAPLNDNMITIQGPARLSVKTKGMSILGNIGDGGKIAVSPTGWVSSEGAYSNGIIIVDNANKKRTRQLGGSFSFKYDAQTATPTNLILKAGPTGKKSYYYDANSLVGFETTGQDVVQEGNTISGVCSQAYVNSPFCYKTDYSTFSTSPNRIYFKGQGRYVELTTDYIGIGGSFKPIISWEGIDTKTSTMTRTATGKEFSYYNTGRSKFDSPFWNIDSSNPAGLPKTDYGNIKYTTKISYAGEYPKTDILFNELGRTLPNRNDILKFSLKSYATECARWITGKGVQTCTRWVTSQKTSPPATISTSGNSVTSTLKPSDMPRSGMLLPTGIWYGEGSNNIASASTDSQNTRFKVSSGNSDVYTYPIINYNSINPKDPLNNIYFLIAGYQPKAGKWVFTPWGTYSEVSSDYRYPYYQFNPK